jgi:hypothetical protein
MKKYILTLAAITLIPFSTFAQSSAPESEEELNQFIGRSVGMMLTLGISEFFQKQDIEHQESLLDFHIKKCTAYGFEPKTDDFRACLKTLESQQNAKSANGK